MNRGRDLVKNTMIIFLGKLCTQFISFFLLPLYTSVLSTSEYGTVDIIITYVSLLVPTITLQLENGLFRYLIDCRGQKEEQKKYISTCLAVVFRIVLILAVIYFLLSFFHSFQFQGFLFIIVLCTIFSNLFLQIARGFGDTITYSLGSVIAGVTLVVCNLLFLLVFKTGISGMFFSIILSNLFCAIFVFLRVRLYRYFSFHKVSREYAERLLKYSIPLIPNGIIWWIMNVSDRTLITLLISPSANGIYAIANKFSNIFVGFYNIYSLSWTEQAAVHIHDEDRDTYFSNTIWTSIQLFFSICICLLAVMPILFPMMIGNEFLEAYQYIPLLMLGMIFNVVVGLLGSLYIAFKDTREVAKTSVLSGILNVLINLIFIRMIGIWAAIISTVISFMITAIIRMIDIQKYVSIRFKVKDIIEMIFVFAIVIVCYSFQNIWFTILNIFIAGGYSIYKNWSFLHKVFDFTCHMIIKYKKEDNKNEK